MRILPTMLTIGAASVVALSAGNAEAQDFFSNLFGGFSQRPAYREAMPPGDALPYAGESYYDQRAPRIAPRPQPRASSGGELAFCVRSCDGRYFPVSGDDNKSRADTCSNLCPASETKVVYGSSIDNAETTSGKNYTDLPNAFRYRKEVVAGCTCNGKDAFGLAKIEADKDPTLRKGDIVASADGLMVAGRSADRRQSAMNFSPASASIRAKYERLPVLAQE